MEYVIIGAILYALATGFSFGRLVEAQTQDTGRCTFREGLLFFIISIFWFAPLIWYLLIKEKSFDLSIYWFSNLGIYLVYY